MRDGRRIVGILLVGELADFARLAVLTVDDRHRHVAVFAREILVGGSAEEDDLILVGEIARIPPLDVQVFRRGNFRSRRGARGGNFVNAVEVVRSAIRREHDARCVEIKFEIANERRAVRGAIERFELLFAAKVRKDDDIVVVAGAVRIQMVVGVDAEKTDLAAVGRVSRVLYDTADAENLVEVENRVREHRGTVRLVDGNSRILFRFVSAVQIRFYAIDFVDELVDGRRIFRVIVFRIALHVGKETLRRCGIESLELFFRAVYAWFGNGGRCGQRYHYSQHRQ